MVRIALLFVWVSVAITGCVRRPGAGPTFVAWAACVVGDRVASSTDLAGEYELRLYATFGPRLGATVTGRLTLQAQSEALMAVPDVDGTPLPGASMPLYGSAAVNLDGVGATAAGDLGDADPRAPGVGVYAQAGQGDIPPGLTLRLGTEANRRGQVRFDGTYMSLMVRDSGAEGLSGEWHSGGVEGEEASGRFCATRP